MSELSKRLLAETRRRMKPLTKKREADFDTLLTLTPLLVKMSAMADSLSSTRTIFPDDKTKEDTKLIKDIISKLKKL